MNHWYRAGASPEDVVFGRMVDAGFIAEDFGDPDSCTGRILLVEIPEDTDARAKLRETVFGDDEEEDYRTDADMFDLMEAGWYFGTIRTGGSIFFSEAMTKEDGTGFFEREKTNYEPFDRLGW